MSTSGLHDIVTAHVFLRGDAQVLLWRATLAVSPVAAFHRGPDDTRCFLPVSCSRWRFGKVLDSRGWYRLFRSTTSPADILFFPPCVYSVPC